MDKGEIVQENHKDLVKVDGLYKNFGKENLPLTLLRAKSNFLTYDIGT